MTTPPPPLGTSGEPLVGVVTPVRNTAPFLRECMRSVLDQTYRNFVYIVLDNGSTDGSAEVADDCAHSDPRVRVIRCSEVVPQVPNYNRAISQLPAGCSYVKVVEADNWLFPDCLRLMVDLGERNPGVNIISSYGVTESRVRFTGLPLRRTSVPGREAAQNYLSGKAYLFGAPTTVLMRGSFVRSRVPFYDESIPVAEDLSACLDAFVTGDLGFVHQILSFVRTENESILTRIKGYEAQTLDRLVLLFRHGPQFFNSAELKHVTKAMLREHYGVLARGLLRRQPPAFWQFHEAGLRNSGLRVEKRRLLAALVREVLWWPLRRITNG